MRLVMAILVKLRDDSGVANMQQIHYKGHEKHLLMAANLANE